MRSVGVKHWKPWPIEPALWLSTFLFIGLTMSVERAGADGGCRSDVKDIASKAWLAPFVFEATVTSSRPLRPDSPLPNARLTRRSHATSDSSQIRHHHVNMRVDKVHKGPLKDKTHVVLHVLVSKFNHRNNNHNNNDDNDRACVVQPNFFQPRKKYIIFADRLSNGESVQNSAPSSHSFTLHSVPVLQTKSSSRQVRKILCSKCATKARIKGLRRTQVKEGKALRLSCRITAGNPQPSVTWYKDGKILKTKNITEQKKKKKLLSQLEISSAKSHDSGEYECVATNVLGNTSMKAKVTVVRSSPPKITTTTVPFPTNGVECRDPYKDSYCLNGGTCIMFPEIQETVCQCADGYQGPRCEAIQPPPLNKRKEKCKGKGRKHHPEDCPEGALKKRFPTETP